ncbi:hypothetical protein [Roseibium sp. SCP14]|uniref:hypothetical protein n=1 Tax=Roseibium sp. SCP14 TaxID=3141375 RepID=UPI003335A50F
MSDLMDAMGLGNFLLGAHLLVFAIGALIWLLWPPKKPRWPNSPVTGGVSILVSVYFAFRMLNDIPEPSSTGTDAQWFLIFSVLTLGALPLVTLFSFFVSGIIVGNSISDRLVRR